ncbi:MAG: hypothetical protein Q7R39_01640 [Dehalococcoidia bacterium]|nr:hypothetical protein [Dehalococcoidia bacterium]
MITRDIVSAYRGFRRQAAAAEENFLKALSVVPSEPPEAEAHRLALHYVTAWKRRETEEKRLAKRGAGWLQPGLARLLETGLAR